MILQSFQQLTGANYFFYYGATVFSSVGIADAFVTQIILGAVNFTCTFGGLYVMQRVCYSTYFVYLQTYKIFFKFGRRMPLIIGGVWQSAWLFAFAAAGTATDPKDNSTIGKCTTICFVVLHLSSLRSYSNDCQRLHVYLGLCHDLGSVRLSLSCVKINVYTICTVVYGSLLEKHSPHGREQNKQRWRQLLIGRLAQIAETKF